MHTFPGALDARFYCSTDSYSLSFAEITALDVGRSLEFIGEVAVLRVSFCRQSLTHCLRTLGSIKHGMCECFSIETLLLDR